MALDPMTAEGFKGIRKALGLTQAELADRLGYGSQVRISEFETDKRPITQRAAAAMQLLLDAQAPPPSAPRRRSASRRRA